MTRFDKIVSPQDRDRVLARLRRETRGLFADFFPISLTEALKAGDDRTRWDTSGAEAFVARLVDLLMDPESPGAGTYGTAGERFTRKIRSARMVHATDVPAGTDAGPETPAHVAPRRIRPLGQGCAALGRPAGGMIRACLSRGALSACNRLRAFRDGCKFGRGNHWA
ncbi:hypothetical protein ACFOHS_13445 [Jhaorihella thermophila]